MRDDSDDHQPEVRRKIRRDETVAIASGVTLALLVVTIVILYLWFA